MRNSREADTRQNMNATQQQVIERLNLYKHDSNAWQWIKNHEKDKAYGEWWRVVAQHFEKVMLPRLIESREILVEYMLAWLHWGQEISYHQVIGDRAFDVKTGLYGTGYICFTNENIHIASFAELTRKYPLLKSAGSVGGFLSLMLGEMVGKRDKRMALQKDGFWTIPLRSVLDAQIVSSNEGPECVTLATNSTIWNLYVGEKTSFTLTAINMARFNQLEGQVAKPNVRDTFTNEHRAKLQHLKELLDDGLITQDDFDAKKQEILSHL